MATTAPSPLASSVEKTNGAKLSRLLINGGTRVLRNVFNGHHPPANLTADLNANYSVLSNLLRRRILNGHQWDKLFPPGGAAPDSKTFDVTLLFLLLTNICGLSPPPSGWHTKPPPSDTSHEANLARVKLYRNVLYGHVTTTGVDTPTFSALWTEISNVLVGLGLDQAEVDKLKAEKGGEQDYLDALLEWSDSEEDIKSQLKNIHQFQTNTQQAVEEVRQTQTKIKQVVEEVHLTQTKTQLTVEEVRQTQTEIKQAVEEVQQTQTKTQLTVEEVLQTQNETKQAVEEVHQTMEEVRQTQTKTEQTVEEVASGLQEVKEAFDSLKEGKDKDRADEVLQRLAKSEFRGDIENYAERFQADTREWVFDRVQNWLDDRSSQNHVMVISGNAGMGKSVIAAVICKRMQEAGKLSGSHFCQYNNVRYRKPQLMLQSLACHLFHALPEYKQALVEQLLRNLGEDLNNMNVEELFALLFKEPLSTVGDPGRNMLIVIDGLDESEYQGRNELLDVIANQFCKLPTWVRFVVTTRPATNIADKLRHLKRFELQSNDEKNLEDVRTFFEKKLQHHFIRQENVDTLVKKLVLKSEGLMLYAYFLTLFINENPSVLNQADLDDSLPLKISSVYDSYFKRLERELMKELHIKEKEFMNLLSAIAASREPLPVGFVSKVLVPSTNSPLARRKLLKALGSVSALLPIRDGCLHVIHKSVKDWLTDVSCYGEHEFIIDENEGHHILASLCTYELGDLKRRGVCNDQFSSTEEYALFHGARHMLHSGLKREPHKLEELTKAYVMDLEIVYAKTCVNSTTASEDLVWIQKQGICTVLSESSQSILKTLLSLLRKYHDTFTHLPRMFFQTVLNEGGTVLSSLALNLLQNKYYELSYMEYIHKETWQGGVVAQFMCSSEVACLDVSPKLDYMVCECSDGMLKFWSLQTGRLLWERPVKVTKTFFHQFWNFRKLPSLSVVSFYRSVVFHPTEGVVIPGILSHVYTTEGDLKPLFPRSNCRFLVCSVSGDKTKILTDCPNNTKCLVMWSLENGSEIARITRNEDILSFAWSQDGRLTALSDSMGMICLLDAMDGFRTLAQTATLEVCGMLKFSPDHRFLFCLHDSGTPSDWCLFRLSVIVKHHQTFSLEVSSANVHYNHKEFESFSDHGFLFGDPIPSPFGWFLRGISDINFVLNEQSLLSYSLVNNHVEMVNTSEKPESQGTVDRVQMIALTLDGQTMYVLGDNREPVLTLTVWDVSSGGFINAIEIYPENPRHICVVPVSGGVLFTTSSGTLELWNFELSQCVQRWTNLSGITNIFPISNEHVACIESGVRVNFLDTTSGEVVSKIPLSHETVIACNNTCQLLTVDASDSIQLSNGTNVLWKRYLPLSYSNEISVAGMLSPTEQFLVIWPVRALSVNSGYVLDAISGNTIHNLCTDDDNHFIYDCKFVSDEACVVSCFGSLKLFNVKCGHLLSMMDMVNPVHCLAACPQKHLLAIGLWFSTPSFDIIQVRLPREEDNRKSKRMNNALEIEDLGGKSRK